MNNKNITENNRKKTRLIWIDEKNDINNKQFFNNETNKNNYLQIKELFQNNFLVRPFYKLEDGIKELKEIKFEHCYVIESGRFFQDYVYTMKEQGRELRCIPNVFVFTSDRFCKNLNERKLSEEDKKYNKEEILKYVDDPFFNRGGAFSGIKKLSSRLTELEKENTNDVKTNNKVVENVNQPIREQNEKMFTFEIKNRDSLVIPSLYKKFISYEEENKDKIKKFFDVIKEDYKDNKNISDLICFNIIINSLTKVLGYQNFPEEILIKYLTFIYTLETNFYRKMNDHLKTKGEPGEYEPFIALMYRGLYLDIFFKNREYDKLTLYRAQRMDKEEILKIKNLYEKNKKNKDKNLPAEILFSNSFLSFTHDKEVYHKFYKKDNNLVNVLFIIEKGGDLDFTCHADLEGLTRYNESEILFFPFSCFTIEDIEENYKDYKTYDNNNNKEEIIVTKIKLSYLGKYKNTIKEAIKTINTKDFILKLKDDDFYKETMKFNTNQTFNGDNTTIINKLNEVIQYTIETEQSSIKNEEYIKQYKNNSLLNVITIKSENLIENNKGNFYAYTDKKNENHSLIIQNKDQNDNENDIYTIEDENSNSVINYIHELKDGRIILCCFDNQIKIVSKNYVQKKLYFEQRLKDHKNLITNIMELNDGKLCSCSFDGSIKLWKKNESNHYSQDTNLIKKADYLFFTIIEMSNYIVSLMKDYKKSKKYLLICSIQNKNPNMKNIDDIELYIKNLIKLKNETFAFGGLNKIFVYNLKGESIKELKVDYSVICLYELNNNSFIVSNDDGKLFLTNNFESVDSFTQIVYTDNNNMIYKIISIEQFKDGTIISKSKERIYIWKMK